MHDPYSFATTAATLKPPTDRIKTPTVKRCFKPGFGHSYIDYTLRLKSTSRTGHTTRQHIVVLMICISPTERFENHGFTTLTSHTNRRVVTMYIHPKSH